MSVMKHVGIVQTNDKMTSKKKTTYYVSVIGGKKFSYFDSDVFDFLEKRKGDSVLVDYEVSSDGNYNNLKTAVEAPKPGAGVAQIADKISPTRTENKKESITAEVPKGVYDALNIVLRTSSMALSYSKDLVVANKIGLEDIFSMAEKMAIFMTGGKAEGGENNANNDTAVEKLKKEADTG